MWWMGFFYTTQGLTLLSPPFLSIFVVITCPYSKQHQLHDAFFRHCCGVSLTLHYRCEGKAGFVSWRSFGKRECWSQPGVAAIASSCPALAIWVTACDYLDASGHLIVVSWISLLLKFVPVKGRSRRFTMARYVGISRTWDLSTGKETYSLRRSHHYPWCVQ